MLYRARVGVDGYTGVLGRMILATYCGKEETISCSNLFAYLGTVRGQLLHLAF